MDIRDHFLLALSFEPEAIREHFEGDEHYEPWIDNMTDGQLKKVAEWALGSDDLYETFHRVLKWALFEEFGIAGPASDDVYERVRARMHASITPEESG